MSKESDAVKRWRRATKERIVEAMGGECVCCGYSRCYRALELHHLDPNKKELQFSKITANPRNWEIVVEELRKCILVCSICHAEIHEGMRQVPRDAIRFDEDYFNYKPVIQPDPCPVCGQAKTTNYNKTCSRSCAAVLKNKINWDDEELIKLYEMGYSKLKIGNLLGVSDVAVKKRLEKIYKNF